MKVTLDLLKKYDAQESFVKFIEENGLDGAALIEVIDAEDIGLENLYFLKKYFIFDSEEKQKFCEVLSLTDSENVWNSKHIENSKAIMESRYVSDSFNVRFSSDISNSNHVFRSSNVDDSNDVVGSEYVSGSELVVESENISMSEQVANSSRATWCENIMFCDNLEDCGFAYKSSNLKSSFFCGFMKDSDHCLFCSGLEGKKYFIFNEEVEKEVFARIMDELRERLQGEEPRMIEVLNDQFMADKRISCGRRFDNVFRGLSEDFYGWVGTLPNYSDDKFIELFFKDRQKI